MYVTQKTAHSGKHRQEAENHSLVIWRATLLAFPVVILIASLIIVVRDLGVAALWRDVAHESEPRSLLGVVFFPGHALSEIPHVFLFGIVWSASCSPPRTISLATDRVLRIVGRALLFTGAIFAWSSVEAGSTSAWVDLSQARLTPDAVAPGIHFRAHVISDVAIAAALCAIGSTLRRTPMTAMRGFRSMVLTAVGLLVVGICVFGLAGVAGPRSIGHSAREVFTYALIIVPLLTFRALRHRPDLRIVVRRPDTSISLMLSVLAMAYIAIFALRVPLIEYSTDPTRSVALNLAAHNFEHVLDLLFLLFVTSPNATT
jgi:hypothetical protein